MSINLPDFIKILTKLPVIVCLLVFSHTSLGETAPLESHQSPPLKIVTTIKPIHSLVQNVVEGVNQSTLLITEAQSAHISQLKPSQTKALSEADVIFMVDQHLEAAVYKSKGVLKKQTPLWQLSHAPNLKRIYHHDHHAHHNHSEHYGLDPHIWLDPKNAIKMVQFITEKLVLLAPDFASHYQTNAKATIKRLQNLDDMLAEKLTPLQNQAFVVYHDAYGYLSERFGLTVIDYLVATPEHKPSPKHLVELSTLIKKTGAACLFSEYGVSSPLDKVLQENTGIQVGLLDPLGLSLEPGKTLYFDLMNSIAGSLERCLK